MLSTINRSGDYSQKTTATGIVQMTQGNPTLSGTAPLYTVFSSTGADGAILRSVTIKAITSTNKGMVRLYLQNGAGPVILWKEIPVPITPVLDPVTIPQPVLPTFRATIREELFLPSGYNLVASTQNTETYNVFAEAFNFTYPGSLPSTDSSFRQEFSNTGAGTVATANSNLNGTGTIATIFTAANKSGCVLKRIVIKAQESTLFSGAVRLFISTSAAPTTWYLFKEIVIPESIQSSNNAAFSIEIPTDDFTIAPQYNIGASTQLGQTFGIIITGLDFTDPA
jgi:hypothetical protein